MVTFTPILKLAMPVFDQDPWDTDINNDMRIIDGSIGNFFGIPNFVGLWKNSQAYVVGQTAIDSADSSMWTVKVAHTSAAAPTTFAQDRTNRPNGWTNQIPSASSLAQNAAASAAAAAASAAQAAASAAAVAGAVPLSGGIMTGVLTLSETPAAGDPALQAATKAYVDARVGGVGFVRTDGTTPMTGHLTLPITIPLTTQAAPRSYVDAGDALKLNLAGGIMTGNITLPASGPTAPTHATTRSYVDGKVTGAGFLPIGGGTLTGPLSVSGAISATGQINSTNGRLMSQSAGTMSVTLHRPGVLAVGLFNDSSVNPQLQFGQMDGTGTPILNFGRILADRFDLGRDFFFSFVVNRGQPGNVIPQIVWSPDSANLQYNNNTKDLVYFTFDGAAFSYRRSIDNALINFSGPIFASNFSSDSRMKQNVVPMTYDISTLMALEVVEFDWILWDGTTGAHDCGLIAQDLQVVYDEAVVEMGIPLPDGTGGMDDPNPTLGMKDSSMIALLVKCVQELNTRLTALEP